MCLSSVYTKESGGEKLLCKNIAKVEADGDKLIFTDIMGIRTVAVGCIIGIDLIENIIHVDGAKA